MLRRQLPSLHSKQSSRSLPGRRSSFSKKLPTSSDSRGDLCIRGPHRYADLRPQQCPFQIAWHAFLRVLKMLTAHPSTSNSQSFSWIGLTSAIARADSLDFAPRGISCRAEPMLLVSNHSRDKKGSASRDQGVGSA